MIVYDAATLKLRLDVDLNIEPYALVSNSIDSVAMGGANKNVDIYTFGEAESISQEKMVSPSTIAMNFLSSVQRI